MERSQNFFSIYLTISIIIVFSFIYLDIPTYLYVLDNAILPKYFYYILALMVAPFLLLKFREFVLYMASPFFLWVLAEIIIHSYDLIDGNEAIVQLVMLRDQYFILAILFGFTVSIARTESYQGIIQILAIIIPVLVIIDFVSPGTFYPIGSGYSVLGRASATYINPNRASEAILLIFLLAIPVMRLHYRLPLLLLAGAAIMVTFSRGALMVWIVFGLFLLITRRLPKYGFVFFIVVLSVLPLLLGIFKIYLQQRQDLAFGFDNIIDRLNFFQTQSLNDYSAQERLEVLQAGWRIFLENPIFGAGTGITDFPSNIWPHMVNTHNQIVMVAAEQGILGIALWAWLLVILWRGRYFQDTIFHRAAATGIFLMSFFDHTLLGELYCLMTYALVSGRRQA